MTPAVAGTAGATQTTIEGGITFFIDPPGQLYTLSGTFNTATTPASFIMEYHATFEDALTLGPLKDILPGITNALGFQEVANALENAGNELAKLPGLDKILNASLKITDIVINTLAQTYQFGVALDFSTIPDPVEFAGIKLMSLSFKVTSTKTTS
jgi:hypothetical protein